MKSVGVKIRMHVERSAEIIDAERVRYAVLGDSYQFGEERITRKNDKLYEQIKCEEEENLL